MSNDPRNFEEWIRIEYTRNKTHDIGGGFLVPEFIESDRPGVVAALYRFVGRILRNERVIKRGKQMDNVLETITRAMKIER